MSTNCVAAVYKRPEKNRGENSIEHLNLYFVEFS